MPGGRGWVKVKSRHTREVIIGLYAEAERTLSAAEALYRFDMFKRGDAAVPALTKLETEQRKVRLAAGAKLALDLEDAMTSVEEDPGGGWFSGSQRDRVQALARQVRADLPTLGPRALPPGSGSSAF